MSAYVCRREHPGKAEVIVRRDHLELLLDKERAHDDYLAAIRVVNRDPEHKPAMLALSRAIVEMASRRNRP